VFIIIPAVLAAVGGASFVAFIAAALVGIFMAFCYGELSSAFPIAGGEYSFAARVLGKGTGFALFLMNTLSLILIIGVIALRTVYAIVALSAIVGRRNGTTAHARYKMPAWPLAPAAVILALGYVTYELWLGNPWQVIIAAGALAVGYAYYYLYLYPQRDSRWTMPAAPHDEHAVDEAGAILMGPALEIHPVGGHEPEH